MWTNPIYAEGSITWKQACTEPNTNQRQYWQTTDNYFLLVYPLSTEEFYPQAKTSLILREHNGTARNGRSYRTRDVTTEIIKNLHFPLRLLQFLQMHRAMLMEAHFTREVII